MINEPSITPQPIMLVMPFGTAFSKNPLIRNPTNGSKGITRLFELVVHILS